MEARAAPAGRGVSRGRGWMWGCRGRRAAGTSLGFGFGVLGCGFMVLGFRIGAWGLGLGFGVRDLGLGGRGFGF